MLSDFGLGRIRHEVTRTETLADIQAGGRLRFVAPELKDRTTNDFRTTQASDIFSLAMTFLNTWTGRPPLHQLDPAHAARELKNNRRPELPSALYGFSARVKLLLWALLVKMWAPEPSNRPSSQEVWEDLKKMFSPVVQDQRHGTRYISTQARPVQPMSIPSRIVRPVPNTSTPPEAQTAESNLFRAMFGQFGRWASPR